MITVAVKGDFKKTEKFLKNIKKRKYSKLLEKYGQKGVDALSDATPVLTGLTADSWYYEIEETATNISIVWKNSNIQRGMSIALLLEYGHATGWGGYVQGRDYIRPAIRPVFDEITESVLKEVAGVYAK